MGARARQVAVAAGLLVGAAALLASGVMDGPTTANAQDGAMEATRLAEPVRLDKHTYLKRLSLDLRKRLPTWEEYEALDSQQDVSPEDIARMLDSEGFLEVMNDYHRDLLWANVSNIQYIQFPWDLTRTTVGPGDDSHTVHFLRRKAVYFRGGPQDGENDFIPCGAWEATFDAQGRPEVTCDPQTGRCLEGWVWVEPYWAPGEQLKVCAFDAQESDTSLSGDVSCGSRNSRREPTCGCGANMRYCDFRGDGVDVQTEVGLALGEQMLKVIEWVIAEDRPYHEILTTRRSFVNGKLIHYYRHQLDLTANVDLAPAPVEGLFLPEVPWTDDTWYPVLQDEDHSGLLTSYAFLLRFQTNRGRVNRFYNAFLDSYFDASKGQDTPGCESGGADLTRQCGCQRCHVAVEPWAAYWARWKQQGAGFLSEEEFPVFDQTCETCARQGIGSCPAYCRNQYVVETVPADREPYVGYLRGYEFLKEQHRIHAAAGPRLWVERTIQDGSLAAGIVSKMWQHFMRRPFNASKADQEIKTDLQRRFVASDYNIKVLVQAIVTHPAYRRIR